MYKNFHWYHYSSWLSLLTASIFLFACSSSGFTKKQREALEHYVDETADAIHFSVSKVQTLLSDYKKENGDWPKNQADSRAIFRSIREVLEEHHISRYRLLEVDNNEVIVEYELSSKKFRQFPRLLESWVIIFSSGNGETLEIVSIFPHLAVTEDSSRASLYSAIEVEKLRNRFQYLLKEKLSDFSVNFNQQNEEKG